MVESKNSKQFNIIQGGFKKMPLGNFVGLAEQILRFSKKEYSQLCSEGYVENRPDSDRKTQMADCL